MRLRLGCTDLQQGLGQLKIFSIGYLYIAAAAGDYFNDLSQAFHK
jgi:hypothetical protein